MTDMGEAKRKRKRRTDNMATADEIGAMMRNQAGSITQDDIPPHLPVFATMEAAWLELAAQFIAKLSRKQQQDAKYIFFHGVQAAANLMIYCAGQSRFEAAADQITADCVAYEKEAEAVLRERRLDEPVENAPPSLPN
jgi:hypothetical protein